MFNKPLEDWPKQPLNTITIWLSVIQPAFKEAWVKSYLNEPLSKDNKEELSPLHTHHLDYRLYLFHFLVSGSTQSMEHPADDAACFPVP
jgi:hypothetical protein